MPRRWLIDLRACVKARAMERETTDGAGQRVEFGLEDAKVWIRETLPREIVSALAVRFVISPDEARRLLAARRDWAITSASYRRGTFIVEPLTPPPPDVTDPWKQLLARALVAAGPLPTADEWWRTATADERAEWMTAFYAEHGGDLTVVSRDRRDCHGCWGRGALSYLAPGASSDGGGHKVRLCDRCRGLGYDRVVVFR